MLHIAAYHSPTTIDEAVRLLAEEGRTVIAGGTDCWSIRATCSACAKWWIFAGWRWIISLVEPAWLRIGAGERPCAAVAQHPAVQALADGILARGAAVCGSPNIRNMATLVGNVASALPSADTPPSLIALNAEVVLVGAQGERVVPLDQFFTGPAKSVRERELIRELRIPLDKSDIHGGFYKIGRTAEDISLVNAATTC